MMSRKGCLIWLMMMTVTVMVLKAMKKMLIKMERRKKERGRKKNWMCRPRNSPKINMAAD